MKKAERSRDIRRPGGRDRGPRQGREGEMRGGVGWVKKRGHKVEVNGLVSNLDRITSCHIISKATTVPTTKT